MLRATLAAIALLAAATVPLAASAQATGNGPYVAGGGGGGAQVYPVVNRVTFSNVAVTNATYTTVASPSVTCPTSTGPVGACQVRVDFAATTGGQPLLATLCIIGTNAGTLGAGSFYSPASVCRGAPTNALAGAFGATDASGSVDFFFGPTFYVAQYPNGTTVAVNCQVFNSGGTSPTASGACIAEALPI